MKRWMFPMLCAVLLPLLSLRTAGADATQDAVATQDAATTEESQQSDPGQQPPVPTNRMPIYIEPFYHFEEPRISTGLFDDEMKAATKDTILALSASMRNQFDLLPVETMYVMSIRLYDLGHKDEATYWFYSAQFRAVLLSRDDYVRGRPKFRIGSEEYERLHAFNAFRQLAGKYINGYAFGDLEHLKDTIRLVQEEGQATIFRCGDVYPDTRLWTIPAKYASRSFDKLLEYIETNEAKIREIREQNKMDEKYRSSE